MSPRQSRIALRLRKCWWAAHWACVNGLFDVTSMVWALLTPRGSAGGISAPHREITSSTITFDNDRGAEEPVTCGPLFSQLQGRCLGTSGCSVYQRSAILRIRRCSAASHARPITVTTTAATAAAVPSW